MGLHLHRVQKSRVLFAGVVLAITFLADPDSSVGQTISGTLLDSDTHQPIPLGLVLMYTESGDSVTSTVSDVGGRFQLSSPQPGDFVLRGAALGYRETPVGVFELGEGGSMSVEYLLEPEPLPMDALLVQVDRPVFDHHLVRNGFVRRLQRGLGKFITPHDIENSSARSTESLLEGIPSVRIGVVRVGPHLMPSPHLGETVQIAAGGGWCEPTVYVDGIRTRYDPESGLTLTHVADLGAVEAIEVYRRAAEIPVEFSPYNSVANRPNGVFRTGSDVGGCGVLVVWTKRGLASGQRAEFGERAAATDLKSTELPEVPESEVPVAPGEQVRVKLTTEAATAQGSSAIWAGVLTTVTDDALVVQDPDTGRLHPVPLDAVEALQVARLKAPSDALRRGAIAGTAFGLGVAGFLKLVCEFSCGPDTAQPVLLPSLGAGVVVGGLVWARGPGREWVSAPLPPSGGSRR